MFETPSSQLVEDNRLQVLQNGIGTNTFEEIYRMSETFDKLR